MQTLLSVLQQHAAKYPCMQPCDAVKLLYQNEFGGGHLIRNSAQSLSRLQKEWEEQLPVRNCPKTESIGNGMVRVYLQSLQKQELADLNERFVRSANTHTGSMESFLKKLDFLQEHFDDCGFAFSRQELDEYLTTYRAQGCPMISHSEQYRAAYHPAYRVVTEQNE